MPPGRTFEQSICIFFEENDPVRQAIFDNYIAVVLNTLYNNFENSNAAELIYSWKIIILLFKNQPWWT